MNLQTNTKYSFRCNASGVLGVEVNNATLLAVVNYDLALNFEDIVTKWRAVYPNLTNVANTPKVFTYYVFKLESGSTQVFAEPWIIEDSVVAKTSVSLSLLIHDVTPADATIIANVISSLGYTVSSSELVSSTT